MNNFKGKSIILFDGVCNLCNSTVNFILKHDKKKQFIFTSLQSDAAKKILLQFPMKIFNLDSIILIENGLIYEKSTAALKISKHLYNGYQLLYLFIILPKFIRDWIYNYIAKNRYNWFGKKDTCMIPSEEIKNRFLTD
ncbi:thiol-disulfide oxidoreductase DCC family protein [Lutibacter sp.]|uniref:thiol-disulfide oxidoreductase DCC family protein n=1 Tax=Lutibacter sp. TaxID=1925666 RepID=UPI00356ADAD3